MPVCPRCGKVVKDLVRHRARCGRKRSPPQRREMSQPYYLGFTGG